MKIAVLEKIIEVEVTKASKFIKRSKSEVLFYLLAISPSLYYSKENTVIINDLFCDEVNEEILIYHEACHALYKKVAHKFKEEIEVASTILKSIYKRYISFEELITKVMTYLKYGDEMIKIVEKKTAKERIEKYKIKIEKKYGIKLEDETIEIYKKDYCIPVELVKEVSNYVSSDGIERIILDTIKYIRARGDSNPRSAA